MLGAEWAAFPFYRKILDFETHQDFLRFKLIEITHLCCTYWANQKPMYQMKLLLMGMHTGGTRGHVVPHPAPV